VGLLISLLVVADTTNSSYPVITVGHSLWFRLTSYIRSGRVGSPWRVDLAVFVLLLDHNLGLDFLSERPNTKAKKCTMF